MFFPVPATCYVYYTVAYGTIGRHFSKGTLWIPTFTLDT